MALGIARTAAIASSVTAAVATASVTVGLNNLSPWLVQPRYYANLTPSLAQSCIQRQITSNTASEVQARRGR